MRKTIFAFASALIILVSFGCNKDKDDSNASIQGKWSAKTARVQSYIGSQLVDDSTVVFTTESLEFKSDNTLLSTDEEGEVETYTYSYDASTKVLTTTDSDDELGTATVTKLTSSDMTLHSEETETFEGIAYKAVTDIYLKR